MSKWVKADERYPEPFALCRLALSSGKVVPGWWTGTIWDGRRLSDDDQVLEWMPFDGQVSNARQSANINNLRERKGV